MKSLFIVILALASVATESQASIVIGLPVRPVNERLSYVISSKAPRPGAPTTRLVVQRSGAVIKSVCRAVLRRPCTSKLVTTLPLREMNIIETLIRDARLGEIVNRSFGVHCLAFSLEQKTLTADNGRVFLREVDSVCPAGERVNVSAAATRLIQKLERLFKLSLKLG